MRLPCGYCAQRESLYVNHLVRPDDRRLHGRSLRLACYSRNQRVDVGLSPLRSPFCMTSSTPSPFLPPPLASTTINLDRYALSEAHADRSSDASMTHFSGTWEPSGEERVRHSIRIAERFLVHTKGMSAPPFGARWVCVADRVGDRRFYLAHRIGSSRVLRGSTCMELSDAICDFALHH